KKEVYKQIWFEVPMKRAAFVTTVSEFSRQKLLSVFAIDPAKVKVVYNPYPASYKRDDKPILSVVPKILQIGSGEHKNLLRLIESLTGISCELVLIRDFDKSIDRMLDAKKIKRNWYFNQTDDEIYELYRSSDLLFFASTYEGFGMPILEAQTVGRAVITSNLASMPEVGGEGVHLVDPYDVRSIQEAVLKLCNDATYRNELIAKGYQNIERFQPETIAKQYLDLYTKIKTKTTN
ncbi:MAG TPA: glycosyltransferase, partial [Cytophagaceae bacterium]|nr:glycosyltransferase [Cytophagaceae bacterium]